MNIVIEGPEGSGKSTLVEALGKHIPNSIVARHPGSTVFGKKIREMIKFDDDVKLSSYVEQIVLAADLCDFIEKILVPNNDKVVISDRSNLVSGMIYGLAGGVSRSRIAMYQNLALALSPPAMHLVVLDANYDDLLVRRAGRGVESVDKFERLNSDFHRAVCSYYRMLSYSYGSPVRTCSMLDILSHDSINDFIACRCQGFVMHGGRGLSIHRVDATLPFDEVFRTVVDIIERVIPSM